ncbi:MAG: acetylglutamate kinase [Chloroflexi bacterium]|nr:acetylglutamate kinase [Chloroflexota bacterium]
MSEYRLLKIGGAELREGSLLDELVDALVHVIGQGPLIVVHGGGADIAELQRRLNLEPKFVDGLRVTDEESMRVAEMVLSGAVNKRLTARLVARGVRAIGLSGVDAGLLRAECLVHPKGDLGRVGEITRVEPECLLSLLEHGFTPIISPISLGMDGRPFNVNADHAALALARALQVREMIFLTDVPGVLRDNAVLPRLRADEAQQLIEAGVITGGMIPKVRSALEAIAQGVGSVRITNLAGLSRDTGTRVSSSQRGGR